MNNYSNFIESLITGTKDKTISWDYLDKRLDLCEKLIVDIEELYEDDSFYASYYDAYFVLISMQESVASGYLDSISGYPDFSYTDVIKLAVVPASFRDIRIISSEDDYKYNSLLIRLRNLIKKDFPNPDDIIEKFISENPALPF